MYKIQLPYKAFYHQGRYYSCESSADGFVLSTGDKEVVEYAVKRLGGKILEVSDGEEKAGEKEQQKLDSAGSDKEGSVTQAVGNSTEQKDSNDASEQDSEGRNREHDNLQREEDKGYQKAKGKGKPRKDTKKAKQG